MREGGGNPHFCSGFRVPPPALRVIPLTTAGSRADIKRLTLWSKVSLCTIIPHSVEQVTIGSPCGASYTPTQQPKSNIFQPSHRTYYLSATVNYSPSKALITSLPLRTNAMYSHTSALTATVLPPAYSRLSFSRLPTRTHSPSGRYTSRSV